MVWWCSCTGSPPSEAALPEVNIFVARFGPAVLRDQPELARIIKDLTFGTQGQRVVTQLLDSEHFGPADPAAGKLLERLLEFHSEYISERELKGAFAAVYEEDTGAIRKHADKVRLIFRVSYCLSADGTSRLITFQHDDPDGVVRLQPRERCDTSPMSAPAARAARAAWHANLHALLCAWQVCAHVQMLDGTVKLVKSEPGKPLTLEIASGCLYAMTGAGSGASPRLRVYAAPAHATATRDAGRDAATRTPLR